MLRRVFIGVGVLTAWGSLAYRIFKYADPMDRMLAVFAGVGVTILAVLISRGPVLPKSGGWDVDGTESYPASDDSHSHGGDDGGHGGSDGGDGGGH